MPELPPDEPSKTTAGNDSGKGTTASWPARAKVAIPASAATPIADMVDELVEKGASPAAIAVAVRYAETSRATLRNVTRNEPSMAPGAIRSRRWRQNRKQSQTENKPAGVAMAAAPGITNKRHAHRAASQAPLQGSLSTTTRSIQEEGKQEVENLNSEPRARIKRGVRLSDDWQPSAADRKFAADRNLRADEIEIEATKFRNYWTNRTDKQAEKLDWSKAWQNWILNMRGTTRERNSVVAASHRLNAKLAEFSQSDLLGGVRDDTRPPHVRLLPSG